MAGDGAVVDALLQGVELWRQVLGIGTDCINQFFQPLQNQHGHVHLGSSIAQFAVVNPEQRNDFLQDAKSNLGFVVDYPNVSRLRNATVCTQAVDCNVLLLTQFINFLT